jgi:hypothetical protein
MAQLRSQWTRHVATSDRRWPGLEPAGTEVEFERRKDTIVVRKSVRGPSRGRELAERLKGRGDVAMTTDEIMALTRGA